MSTIKEQPAAVLFLRARHIGADGRDWEAEEHMIARQRDNCAKAAELLAADIIAEYVEHGGAGAVEHRPQVLMMLDELRVYRDAKFVIIDTMDRLARKVGDWRQIELELEAAGAELIVAQEILKERKEAA